MFDFSPKDYDVVVCGAGPAGLKAAHELLRLSAGKLSILILDRKAPWTEPVICAEAVSTGALQKYWEVKDRFVRGPLSGVYFVSPNGSKAEFYRKDCGLQLNRAELHRDMFEAAKELGVEHDFAARASSLSRAGGFWTVTVEKRGERVRVKTRVVVDATGPGNKLTKALPEFADLEDGSFDCEPAMFAIVENVPHSREHIELYFGSEFHGGYGWVFPRDGVEVNLGVVIAKDAVPAHSPKEVLLKFLERFPGAKVKGTYGGMIACGQSKKPVAKLGLFKVGDAASTVNPLSRGGIVEAMKSGKCAAESIMEWLAATNAAERCVAEMAAFDRWYALQGKTHERIARAKPAFNQIPDAKLNRAAGKLSKLTREKSTILRIFLAVLATSPSLLWKLRSFLRG